MGAASCSGTKATSVEPSINKIQLNQNARDYLKQLNNQVTTDKEKMAKLLKKDEKEDDIPNDQNTESDKLGTKRKHQKLWDAIEENNVKDVEIQLTKVGEQGLLESEIYDQTGQSMIHKAASLGHAEVLMLLLERTGAKPDLVNGQLATPLHLACKNNRESVAKFLIGCGVDVNVQDEHGQTPLLICCIHGHFELAQLIVESSFSGHTPEPLEVDIKDHRGLTPLNCAAIKGDLQLTKLLIERGGSSIEEASPKGCTPLLYSARGGYAEVVRYLLEKGASPLKQDTSGGTVLHHAIEKSHLEVLQVLIEHGVDVYSAIEIADNAGRTPIFEAIDSNVSVEIIRFLTQKRSKGGFGASVNVINYNGQTPLFSAVREGNIDIIRCLVEDAGAQVDLTGGETAKEDDDQEEYDSVEEKYFMEAYRNAATPLHLASLLGYDHIMHYLIDKGANPNLQTGIKGFAALHLAVLANKPEIIIELLTKTTANPHMPDYSGRTLQDMVEIFIPDYLESFNNLIENLHIERIDRLMPNTEGPMIATHYYNPDDEREIKGTKDEQDANIIYQKEYKGESPEKDEGAQTIEDTKNPQKKFLEMDESEIEIEEGKIYERDVENMFGRKIALSLIAANWKIKESAMKIIFKQAEKVLNKDYESTQNVSELVKACTVAIDSTSKEKVIKVLNVTLSLLALIISSAKVEQAQAIETFKNTFVQRNIVMKLLQKSEEGNTRMTNKIHECLLDFSFHPKIGEAHVASFILQRIQAHYKASQLKQQAEEQEEAGQKKAPLLEGSLGSFKGLLAQLALLYKFVNSFGVSAKRKGPLCVADIINSILPSFTHQSQDVRNASTKILLDVHRFSGAVKEEHLASLPEKLRQGLMEKIAQVVVEKQQDAGVAERLTTQDQQDYSDHENSQNFDVNKPAEIMDIKEKIIDKGQSKDWQERDIALRNMKEAFENSSNRKLLQQEDFLTNCTILLKSCLEENNISLYLSALEVGQLFFAKALFTEVVQNSLPSLIRPIVLKTTDTNTRVRKKGVELIIDIWNMGNSSQANVQGKNPDTKRDQISSMIAEVICDQSMQEKAIIGRLGLFIKRASSVESTEELGRKPHQLIMGKNYEEITEFACQWVTHKNTKVRQNALKLIIEVCRLNSIDPRGAPFKQRIINFILGLRPSLRDPLVKKINEVCQQKEGEGDTGILYIDVTELELNVATKTRSASVDIVGKMKAAKGGGALPDIGAGSMLPKVTMQQIQPTIVLPHSEPLTEEQKAKFASLINAFSLEIITCFNSQFWSARQSAIEKVGEQLHNLDPNRRDAMSSEINMKNLPIEETFQYFLQFIEEGTKDPVLKIFLSTLELLQKGLPTYFRYLQPFQMKKEILPLVSQIIKKSSDLKAKVREASINFCLYLSHQSPIGPETMVMAVLSELEQVLSQNSSNVAANLGNSHMIASCFNILISLQTQMKILEAKSVNQELFKRFMSVINLALKHQNPLVRKEAESLFKVLYAEFGDKLDAQLVGQKAQLSQKLIQDSKVETGAISQQQQAEHNIQRAQTQIRTELVNQPALNNLLKGAQEHIANLKLPNAKKRLQAIVEIKKAIQKEIQNINSKTARDLFEPLCLLMRQLLQDENTDIYLETLSLLKFVVGSLAPHLSTLDLHLMLGQFIGIIVGNTISTNMRTQMASDKVIIFFAKHANIGPLVVARDVLKNLEKIVKAVAFIQKKEEQQQLLQERRPTLLRFFSILQLMLQHFSIVLCYQAEFYEKCIEIVADTMLYAGDDQIVKSLCVQIIMNLHAIDYKLLEANVAKLDVARKTPLRKAMIELEHQQKQGKNIITQDHHAFVAGNSTTAPDNQFRDTKQSFMSSSRTSLFSPGSTMRGNSPGLGASQYEWSKKSIDVINKQAQASQQPLKNSELRRRTMLEQDMKAVSSSQVIGSSIQAKQMGEGLDTGNKFALPEINPTNTQYGHRFGSFGGDTSPTVATKEPLTKMSLTSTGGAGFNSNASYAPRQLRTISYENQTTVSGAGVGGGIRPPLYVPTKRDSVRGNSTTPNPSGSLQGNQTPLQNQPKFSDGSKTNFTSKLYNGQ